MTFRIAVVQPITNPIGEDEKNVAAPVSYRRTHPNGPWIYTGDQRWEFQYVPGDEFPVFDTAHGKVGLAMCSEVYMPEVTRALALRGAELIFMPAGTDKGKLWASWRNLI